MCQRALDLAAARRRLTRRWNGQADIGAGPVLTGSRPEENAGELLALLRFVLDVGPAGPGCVKKRRRLA